jgi:hypothetical protein
MIEERANIGRAKFTGMNPRSGGVARERRENLTLAGQTHPAFWLPDSC